MTVLNKPARFSMCSRQFNQTASGSGAISVLLPIERLCRATIQRMRASRLDQSQFGRAQPLARTADGTVKVLLYDRSSSHV
jgi:hypothetical protein